MHGVDRREVFGESVLSPGHVRVRVGSDSIYDYVLQRF